MSDLASLRGPILPADWHVPRDDDSATNEHLIDLLRASSVSTLSPRAALLSRSLHLTPVCPSVLFLDSSKTLKDVLSEFKDGGALSKYNPEEVCNTFTYLFML